MSFLILSSFVEFVHTIHQNESVLAVQSYQGSVVYTATALLIFLLTLILGRRWGTSSRVIKEKMPPSPPGEWPIIGHLHLLGATPHKSMAELSQKHGPIMLLRLGTKPHVVVLSPEMAKEFFKHHDLTFSHRPQLAVSRPMDHMNHGDTFRDNNAVCRKLRKIFISEMMSPKRRQQSLRIREEETSNLVKSIHDDVTASESTPPVKFFIKITSALFNCSCTCNLACHLNCIRA